MSPCVISSLRGLISLIDKFVKASTTPFMYHSPFLRRRVVVKRHLFEIVFFRSVRLSSLEFFLLLATIVAFRLSSFFFDCFRLKRRVMIIQEFVANVLMRQKFPVSEYIFSNPSHLDARRFDAMRDVGAVEDLPDRNGTKRLNGIFGWGKGWNHWGGRGCLTIEVTYDNIGIIYLRCEQEGVFIRRLGEIFNVLEGENREEFAGIL